MNRNETLEYIRQNPDVSVLIVGAGVNGIGTFRDLALQGVDVLLVDKGDFCSGASAASSHMAHGGIRYLENGEFRLVREAVQERNRLIQNAPHYVRPLPTVIPIFKWFSGLLNAPLKFFGLLDKPAERGAVVIKAGLLMYDAYTGRQRTVPRHSFAFRQRALGQHPRLNPGILCTASYYDGAILQPERLCVEMALDAEAASPRAHAANYLKVAGALGNAVTLVDELSGEKLAVRPQVVINAAGPWIDFANQAMGQTTRFIGGTKGSHLIINHPELRAAVGENEFFFENKDGRIVLIFPFFDKVIVGTSDLRIDDPDAARCTEAEVDYFLEMLDVVFPALAVRREQIVFRFSGVRPLPAAEANSTGQISRDHSIRTTPAGTGVDFPIYSLVGGKWTSFRAFAEQVTDTVLATLGRTRQRDTRALAIGGGRDYPHSPAARQDWATFVAARAGLPVPRVQALFQRYGTRAAEMAGYLAVAGDDPLQHKPDYSRQEIVFLLSQEKAARLDDLFLRRSLLGWLGQLTPALVAELADIAGETLDWTEAHKQAEIQRALVLLADRHGVQLTNRDS